MARQNHKSFISNFKVAVVAGLLISLTATGVAVAQDPVPLIYQPLVPDTAATGTATGVEGQSASATGFGVIGQNYCTTGSCGSIQHSA